MWLLLSLRNLVRNVRRTVAILFTVALGTGALFSFDGFIHGVLGELKESTIHSNYGYGQIHTAGYREQTFQDPIDHWIFDGESVEHFAKKLEGVNEVFPRVSFSALLKNKKATVSGRGQGIDAEKEARFFHSLNIVSGNMLTDEPDGIVLGSKLAKSLDVDVGDTITVVATSTRGMLSKGKFQVTGIFETGSLEFDGTFFRLPIDAAKRLLKTSYTELFSLDLKENIDFKEVKAAIEKEFPFLEVTPFHVLDKIYYQHSVDWLKAQFQVVQIIILSIVILGIFNTVSASILERKQEIGNLRANGESFFQIMRLILAEGSILGGLGSLLGMLIAYTVLMIFINNQLLMPPGPGQTKQFAVHFSFTWQMGLYSFALSLISSCFAAFLAGYKVVKMPIVRSLAR